MKIRTAISISLILLAILAVHTFAQSIPRVIAYQGVLLENNRQPKPDTLYAIQFALWDKPTGGNQMWASGQLAPIRVTNGSFSTMLGPFPDTVLFDRQYFLEISVEGNVLSPRVEMSSVPYAIRSGDGVPVGTIQAFAGDISNTVVLERLKAKGWMPCDGTPLKKREYQELAEALGTAWGSASTDTLFSIPDLNGVFLRGVDNGQGKDPDLLSRVKADGSSSYAGVGSYQEDATARPRTSFTTQVGEGEHDHSATTSSAGEHSHSFDRSRGGGAAIYAPSPVWGGGSDQQGTNATGNHTHQVTINNSGTHVHSIVGGDNETRPKNVAVYWIIKVK